MTAPISTKNSDRALRQPVAALGRSMLKNKMTILRINAILILVLTSSCVTVIPTRISGHNTLTINYVDKNESTVQRILFPRRFAKFEIDTVEIDKGDHVSIRMRADLILEKGTPAMSKRFDICNGVSFLRKGDSGSYTGSDATLIEDTGKIPTTYYMVQEGWISTLAFLVDRPYKTLGRSEPVNELRLYRLDSTDRERALREVVRLIIGSMMALEVNYADDWPWGTEEIEPDSGPNG